MRMTAGPRITTNSAGRMQNISGKRIFTVVFCARSSARAFRRSRPSIACTRSASHDRHAVAVGLTDGPHEVADVVDVDPLGERVQRRLAGHAGLHVLQHPLELLGQRTGTGRAPRGRWRRRARARPRRRS